MCRKCITARRACDRSAKRLKFVIHSLDAVTAFQVAPPQISGHASEPEVHVNAITPQSEAQQSQRELKRANILAASSPRMALSDPEVAELFAHYTNTLAPWYDLNDSQRLFGSLVPENALDCPILFKAVIAFSASHRNKTSGGVQELAPAFHAACVQDFLLLMNRVEPRSHGNELAATCLLRSYEIMNGKYPSTT